MSRFTALEREITAAKQRIGDTAEEALDWLIDSFKYPTKPIESDNGKDMLSTEIDRLGYEVIAFLGNDWGDESRRFGMVSSSRRNYKMQKVQERQEIFPNIPDRAELSRLQKEVVSLLERFLSDKVVSQRFDRMTLHLVRIEKHPPVLQYVSEPVAAFTMLCMFILSAAGERLRSCKDPGCNRLFVALKHPKKRFCSDKCQSRTGTRKWRARKKRKGQARNGARKRRPVR